ncbi:LOB domain-containing protein 25-like [Diospyros lotus]|uniref:LOB domain-containing protein 25-like n=1 Tax=Diospyros lotus TaxID=55363 RepID=UPI00225C3F01|nr:LOB domain-containing protein 25-like [Diospyros lotus]
MASSSSYNSPCAACKFLRRKCMRGCVFAPYFPPEEPEKFANIHKIFGASNVSKLLNDLHPCQREDAVNSLAYEAQARVRDPVYGCVGAISFLQAQVEWLQKELDAANADLIRFACSNDLQPPAPANNSLPGELARRSVGNYLGSGVFCQTPSSTSSSSSIFPSPYAIPWNFDHYPSGDLAGRGRGRGNI